MTNIEEKAKLVLDHEEWFADSLAVKVVERPVLSVWMILIPIVFLYYFYRFRKFADGRKEFVKNYMISRRQVMARALALTEGDARVGVADIPGTIGLVGETKKLYGELLEALFDHYVRLLKSSGGSYNELVRAAYGASGEYAVFLNNLTRVEGRLNRSFQTPDAAEDDFSAVIGSIDEYSETIRRDSVEKIYSATA